MKALLTFLPLAAILVVDSNAAATQFYGLVKGRRYVQSSTTVGTIRASDPYRAHSFIYATAITSGSIRKPNNTTRNLAPNGDHVGYVEFFATEGTFNTQWPAGSYTLSWQNAADGSRNSTMFLGNDLYPPIPRISNFNEAQNVDHTQPFTIRWDALGLPANEFAVVRVTLDGAMVFETPPIINASGALTASSTSVTIPSGRLLEGKVYSATLTTYRSVTRDTTAVAGAIGYSGYSMELTFPIRTRFTRLDLNYYGFEKRVHFEQSSTATPLPRANAFELAGFAFPSGADTMQGGSITPPGGSARAFVASGSSYFFSQNFATQAAMESAFPAGAYNLSFNTRNNGVRTNTMTLSGDAYPNIPQVVNFYPAQRIRPGDPFTLTWSIPGATANDHVRFVITEGNTVILATPEQPGTPNALTGANTSFAIPAGTLRDGRVYTGIILCARHTARDSVNYVGVPGVAGYARVTRFPLAASSAPAPAPRLTNARRIGNQTEFTFESVVGENYTLQHSANLPGWTTWTVINATSAATTIRFPVSTEQRAFYRVVAGP